MIPLSNMCWNSALAVLSWSGGREQGLAEHSRPRVRIWWATCFTVVCLVVGLVAG